MAALGFARGLGLGAAVGAGRGVAGVARYVFAGAAMPAGARVARVGPATRWRADRVLATVAADAARFDHDPATGAYRGLLLEPAATNLIPRHDDARTGWTGAGAVTGPGAAAPDGGPSQRVSVEPGGYGPYLALGFAVADGDVLTLSAYLRADAPQTQGMGFNGITDGGNNAGAPVPAGPGWTRQHFTLSARADSGVYVMPFSLHASNGGGGNPARIGDLWGMQMERGAAPTSLVPTAGAAATRGEERLVLDWARFGRGDGPVTLRVGFDDGSSQLVAATVAGGTTTLTAAMLARRWLRLVEIA